MKAVFFACLLAIAGVSTMPQASESDVAPAQNRIVDRWFTDLIQRYVDTILRHELDPMNKDIFHFDTTVIPGLLYLVGHIRDLHCVGLSALYINYVHYNILMGRLDFDIVMPRVKMTAGQWATSGRYGDSGGTADASGSLEIRDLRLVCDTLLTIVPGWPVTIHNINPDLTLGEIRADFQVGWKCLGCETESDISERVNNGLNVVLPGMMDTYKNEINTMLGEAIRWAVNRFW